MDSQSGLVRVTASVEGRVQGVGFRWATRARALELELTGSAENLPDGRVLVVAEGDRERCAELVQWLQSEATPGSVDRVDVSWGTARGDHEGFVGL